jgi:hypothetical protein
VIAIAQRRDKTDFVSRYMLVLEAAANRVHWLNKRDVPYVSTAELAAQIVKDPFKAHVVRDAFWKGVKVWRVVRMLQDANFLGAFEDLDIRCVRGRGMCVAVKRRAKLRVIKGGKR